MTIVKPESKTNKKQKYTLEFEIKSSPKILYNYLSTASGLEEWFADKVNIREGDFICCPGGVFYRLQFFFSRMESSDQLHSRAAQFAWIPCASVYYWYYTAWNIRSKY